MDTRTRHGILSLIVVLGLAGSACTSGSAPATKTAAPSAPPVAATAKAAATPTEAPIELLGKFDLDPARGGWGTPVTAMGTALKPNASYDLEWTTVTGSWQLSADRTEYKGRQYKPAEVKLTTVTTDAAGAFRTVFAIPRDFGFQHDVLVVESGGQVIRNKAGFDVDLDVRISPTSGPVGTLITIEARGIGWRQMENSWLVSYDNAFTGWLSSVTTKGIARAVIPATGPVGTHVVTVLHGDFTFPYLNMQQSPEPGRPQFHIPFTVTDGPAVAPPAPETQRLAVLPAKPVDRGIWTAPGSGVVGDRVQLVGKGLPSGADLTLEWTSMSGNRVANGYEKVTHDLGHVGTTSTGALGWTFAVPDDLGGVHTITAKMGNVVVGQTDFTIQPSVFALPVSRGPSGTKTAIHLQGVGWTETANIYNVTYDNAYIGYACGFNSGGDVTVDFVVSGARGWHYLDLYPGIYKGVETRPLNFRVPQLTFADDHPGEVLPAFHLAFYVE